MCLCAKGITETNAILKPALMVCQGQLLFQIALFYEHGRCETDDIFISPLAPRQIKLLLQDARAGGLRKRANAPRMMD